MNLTPTFSLFVIPIPLLHFSPQIYKPSNGNTVASLQPQEHNYKTDSYLANTTIFMVPISFGFSMPFQMCRQRLDKFEESDES